MTSTISNTTSNARKPVYAGQFYPESEASLRKQIEQCFLSSFGPGSVPDPDKKHSKSSKSCIKAAIVPHAGYLYSGHAAAFAYKEICEAKQPDAFLILGTNHSSSTTCLCDQDFETPFGLAKTDKEFVNLISKKCSVKINNAVHSREHSIEVQIPFLQFIENIDEKSSNQTKIVPLLVSEDIDFSETGKSIATAIKDSKKEVTLIVSADFTHFGFNYGYTPFMPGPGSREKIKELDFGAIDFIKKMDSRGFISYIGETGATICGAAPIALLIETLRNLHPHSKISVEVLRYYTSAEIAGGFGSSVSYASIIFR